jgi:hypothetical protein
VAEEMICSGKKLGRDLVVDSLTVAGKEPVREMIILTPADVCGKKSGQPSFKFSYRVGNLGFMASRGFDNFTYFWDAKNKNNDKVVSRQNGMALGPNEYKVINDEISFNLKDATLRDGVIMVRIDALSKIAEDNETNNEVSSNIIFRGFQGSANDQALHIEFLRVGNKTPVQGRTTLTKKEAKGSKENRYAFTVEFVIRNYGVKAANDVDILFLLDGKKFSRQQGFTLAPGESKLVQAPIYFPIHNGKLSVAVDPERKYSPAQGCKQSVEQGVYFQGF